jgi:hypothetical protein
MTTPAAASAAALAGAIVVKAHEWRQDVLYGPYIFQAVHFEPLGAHD